MDGIVQRDAADDDTGAFTQNPWLRRVADRNEPEPERWLPGDPFDPAEATSARPVGN
jgi:hypothetical protein